MSFSYLRRTVRLLCLGSLPLLTFLLLTPHARASAADAAAQPPQPEDRTYPQIARISFAQGDVRISRGVKGAAWETATTGTPLESGFSLVTGAGRAEIEFEDASTLYLADNSALAFEELTTTGTSPHTALTLVSGTLTLDMKLTLPGEQFLLKTPGHSLTLGARDHAFLRVDAYLNGMALTPQRDMVLHVPGLETQISSRGQTVTYLDGSPMHTAPSPAAYAEWDTWVAQRVIARDAAMTAAMHEAGLTSPVPGLADLQGHGQFFACAPYGTCWEPNRAATPASATPANFQGHAQAHALENPSRVPSLQLISAVSPVSQSYALPAVSGIAQFDDLEDFEDFPCNPNRLEFRSIVDPRTRPYALGVDPADPTASLWPWWAVCHTGSWIHRNHRYAWVAGTHRHHRPPVHWVKYDGKTAYVPIHPRDVTGKPPLNLKYGVFVPLDRDKALKAVAFDPAKPVKLLDSTPKEFLKPDVPPLARAEAPHLEGRLVNQPPTPGKASPVESKTVAIAFDSKSQSFLLPHQVSEGGRTTTVVQHFGGTYAAGNAHSGGGGFSHASNGGGGFNRSGGGNSGASSRSGGGEGGGGGHSSGGAGGAGSGGGAGGASGGSHK